MIADQPPPIICVVSSVTDADTFRCADGTRIRVAGVEGNERKGGCHIAVCPPLPHARAVPMVERLVLRKALTCQPVGTSYRRIVARCTLPDRSDLRCRLNAAGATVDWPAYVTRYHLEPCRGR